MSSGLSALFSSAKSLSREAPSTSSNSLLISHLIFPHKKRLICGEFSKRIAHPHTTSCMLYVCVCVCVLIGSEAQCPQALCNSKGLRNKMGCCSNVAQNVFLFMAISSVMKCLKAQVHLAIDRKLRCGCFTVAQYRNTPRTDMLKLSY